MKQSQHLLSVWPWCRFTVLLHNLPPAPSSPRPSAKTRCRQRYCVLSSSADISEEGERSASCWIRPFSFALRLNPHKLQGMPCSDLIVGFLGTCPQLSPEEEEKRRIRRERNKLAAAKCRNRRRELTEKLQAVRALHTFLLPCCLPFGPARRALLSLR